VLCLVHHVENNRKLRGVASPKCGSVCVKGRAELGGSFGSTAPSGEEYRLCGRYVPKWREDGEVQRGICSLGILRRGSITTTATSQPTTSSIFRTLFTIWNRDIWVHRIRDKSLNQRGFCVHRLGLRTHGMHKQRRHRTLFSSGNCDIGVHCICG